MRPGWAVRWREAPADAAWVAWSALAGLVMGAAALQGIVDLFGIQMRLVGEIFVIATPTAVLSAGAAAVGARVRHPLGAALATLGASVVAGALCAGPTFVLTMLIDGERIELGALVLAVILGAFYGAPLGAVLGTVYAIVIGAGRALTARRSCADLDLTLVAGGLGWMLVGAGCGLLPLASESLALAGSGGWALALAGCAAAAVGVARVELRRRFVANVRAGRVPGWSIEPRAEGAAAIPPLFPFGGSDALVISHEVVAEGPFRSGGGRRAWAAVPR
ncbi:MAG: hypothetical protein M5U28_07125 [Sandaracinaceae bacterium]|nr:hypothetical protein [Sandaracinaceae bacterium]